VNIIQYKQNCDLRPDAKKGPAMRENNFLLWGMAVGTLSNNPEWYLLTAKEIANGIKLQTQFAFNYQICF
jgi:hypothetical protein